MKLEDYFKYYIQGSDHYLIPTDEFEELFNEMNNWREETKELKEIIKGKTICYDEEEHRELKDRIDKAIKWVDNYMDEWDFNDEVWQDINNLYILLKGKNNG